MEEIVETVAFEDPFDGQAIVDKFREFRDRSKKQFDENYDSMREDRAYLNGQTQWDKKDSKYVSKSRYRQTLNIIKNNVNSVVNQYSVFPFTFYTGEPEDDQLFDAFMKRPGNSVCGSEALKNSTSLGLGVMAIGIEKDGLPCIYAIQDFNRCVLDPESTELDGSDMTEAALIDYRGRRWVELNYGPEYLPGDRETNIVPCRTGMIPIVTYFVLEEGGCHVYTLVNNHAEDSGVLPIDRVPVFPVYGDRYFDDDGDVHWSGIVDAARSIQKITNLSVTQLAERLSLSPKPQWRGTAGAFKGLDNYYRDAGQGNNPIVPYNSKDLDTGEKIDPPERFDQTVQYQDLVGITGNILSFMGSVTGVDSRGIVDNNTQKTATEINYAAETFSTNIRHYMVHLQASMKSLGECLGTLLGIEGQVKLAQGPIEYLGLKQARAEIVQLIQVAEPNQKPALIDALIQTYPDNPTMARLYAQLHSLPAPTPMEAQMQQTIDLMKQKIDTDQQQMQQMDQQLKYMEQQLNNNDKNIELELTKLQLGHEYDMENTILKAQLDQGTDANRAAIEEQRSINKLEGEAQSIALKLQGQKAALAVQDAKDRLEVNKKRALDGIAVASAAARARNAAEQKPEEKEAE